MELFEVGGCIRDEILGIPSKDIDFSVVMTPEEVGVDSPYLAMNKELERRGFKIFLRTPDFLTTRAQFPSYRGNPGLIDSDRKNLTADFVLARKESDYTDGRRPDKVEVGTLEDDLARRDFTMNAIAKDSDGNYIDPFNGQQDIADRIIRCVGDPMKRLTEDALRAVRALRFAVTKGFVIHPDTLAACNSPEVVDAIKNKISDERIQVELSKMFRFDTIGGLDTLGYYFNRPFRDALFSGSISLDATMKQRGRGK